MIKEIVRYNYIYNEGKGGFITEDDKLIPWISANPEPYSAYSFEAMLVTLLGGKVEEEEIRKLNIEVLFCLNKQRYNFEQILNIIASS